MNQEKIVKLQALAPAEYLTGDEVIDLSHPSIRRFAGTLRAKHADDVSFPERNLSTRVTGCVTPGTSKKPGSP